MFRGFPPSSSSELVRRELAQLGETLLHGGDTFSHCARARNYLTRNSRPLRRAPRVYHLRDFLGCLVGTLASGYENVA